MSLRFVFKPDAKQEFFEAIAWYERERPGLGREFAHEVVDALKRARLQPELFPKTRGRARKIRLRRFRAYSVYFAVKNDTFSIVAVFHGARNPAELRRRLK
ncbi:MAG: type II toxin-antitoxin system RelE/ParE family toxin [Verrucomicrobiales bacterium]|nr:type II toxin-antitoxin system RelE/ParE family toxin [Verrucomicrobiales bacterium]